MLSGGSPRRPSKNSLNSSSSMLYVVTHSAIALGRNSSSTGLMLASGRRYRSSQHLGHKRSPMGRQGRRAVSVAFPQPKVLTEQPERSHTNRRERKTPHPEIKESQQALFPAKAERELRKLGVGDALVCLQHEALHQPPQRVRNRRSPAMWLCSPSQTDAIDGCHAELTRLASVQP